jgi:hypothetical protein
MDHAERMFIDNIRGKIICDVEIKHPSFFSRGYLKFIVEDPKTGEEFRAQVNLG